MPARPRFSSAAAAAAAVAHGDGFKPREERGWEEFHEDLEIDAAFPVFSSLEVDGVKTISVNGTITPQATQHRESVNEHNVGSRLNDRVRQPSVTLGEVYNSVSPVTTPRRGPGRPPRRPDAMLKGIGISPDAPKIIPPPGFNPREKLTLPKPSFRPIDPFARFEDREQFVDQAMSHVGYQETEVWARQGTLIRVTEGNIEDDLLSKSKQDDKDDGTGIGPIGVGRVEYDMDEQDIHWLNAYNDTRKEEELPEIKPWMFEVMMTKIEKEWHALEKRIPKPNPKPPQTHRPRSSSAAAVNGELPPHGEEQDTKCAICDDGDCENTNAIVFCDGCDLAVHQECYGVPFIPEGQWLCRKCQLIGRGTPTCIFCPNTDGAFKQTNASRWSHLLCAIWIPEVSIGNGTFMEPVMEVEKVPKQRWKLTCYICRQKMGACIQCGNKNCYIAFHVSCARKARLFLKMKSTHGGPASLDASVLKAFCDKHVPAEWRREHDVDNAIIEAMDYYRYTMRGRLWADSQQAALTAIPPPPQDPVVDAANSEESSNPKIMLKFNTKGTNQTKPPKIVWKLPSGAPVIPQALYNSIESSIQRFSIKKRREFAAEVCKYWTLKREARRGAALLKRLQLQMETFTSMEIPRRNFVGMGAAGRVRLQRRIDFAETLLDDVNKLQGLCRSVMDRERQKLEDARALRDIIDTVYFPSAPLLTPILERASKYVIGSQTAQPSILTYMNRLDSTGSFASVFADVNHKINNRTYETVLDFAKGFSTAIVKALNTSQLAEEADTSAQSNGLSPVKAKSQAVKNLKALAKKIVKAVQPSLEDAVAKECQLLKTAPDDIIQAMSDIFEATLSGQRMPTQQLGNNVVQDLDPQTIQVNGHVNGTVAAKSPQTSRETFPEAETPLKTRSTLRGSLRRRKTDTGSDIQHLTNGNSTLSSSPVKKDSHNDAHRSATSSSNGDGGKSSSCGGVPWYMAIFKPDGTTIEEEQWMGRDLVDGEELSDMDEEEMSGLLDDDSGKNANNTREELEAIEKASAIAKKKKAAARKRKRGWSIR